MPYKDGNPTLGEQIEEDARRRYYTEDLLGEARREARENDRLREALARIASLTPGGPHIDAKDGMGAALASLDRARDIAREALADKGE